MTYTIAFKPSFFRAIKKLPKVKLIELDNVIARIRDLPKTSPAKRLKGHLHLYRLRVGDYRLVYHLDDKAKRILFVTFAHRKDVYRRLGNN